MSTRPPLTQPLLDLNDRAILATLLPDDVGPFDDAGVDIDIVRTVKRQVRIGVEVAPGRFAFYTKTVYTTSTQGL